MKKIFIIIPRRASVRYMLLRNFIDYLKNHCEVIILTSINDEVFVKEFSDRGVIIEYIPLRDGQEFILERILRVFRNYLGIAHYDLATIDRVIRYEGLIKWVFYRLLVFLLKLMFFLQKPLRRVDLAMSKFLDREYERLFDKYQPDLVFIHSIYELTTVPIFRLAKRKKIKTLGVVFSWDNLSNKGEIYSRCDKVVVWNEMMRDFAINFHGYKFDDIFVVGATQFDYYFKYRDLMKNREDFFNSKGLDLNKKLIVYTTVPKRIGGDNEIKSIRRIIREINNGELQDCQLLIRVYTRDDPKRYEEFAGLEGVIIDSPNNIFTKINYTKDDIAFCLDLAATAKYANVLVNIASTTSFDACVFNTPVVNIAINNQRFWYQTGHYEPLVGTGAVKLALAEDDIIMLIRNYFNNQKLQSEERKGAVEKFCGKLDGENFLRIGKIVLDELIK